MIYINNAEWEEIFLQLSVFNRTGRINSALLSVSLLPRIVVSDGSVLELLAHDLDLLVVVLTVFPLLDVVDAVAVGALQLLHG